MRVIFVGMHNKPDLQPLCLSTKTGKLLNRIISELPTDLEVVKTNLFDVDCFPTADEMVTLSDEWFWTHSPNEEDVVVLLGAIVHKKFTHDIHNLIKLAHPASKRSHVSMDEYVCKSVEKIKQKIGLF